MRCCLSQTLSLLPPLLQGFGCKILAHDVYESEALKAQGVQYVPLEQLMAEARGPGCCDVAVLCRSHARA